MLSELHSLNFKLCSKQYNKIFFCTWLWCHSQAVADEITTQPKQGWQTMQISSSMCILLCLHSWPILLLLIFLTPEFPRNGQANRMGCLMSAFGRSYCLLPIKSWWKLTTIFHWWVEIHKGLYSRNSGLTQSTCWILL